jgi:hypothetical protein
VPAEAADDVGWIGRGIANRVDVRDHLGAGIAKRGPGLPGFLEEAQVFRAVHPRARALAKGGRRDQLVLAGLQPGQQPIGTLGLLGGALDHATHQKELRIVASMQLGIDRLHFGCSVRGKDDHFYTEAERGKLAYCIG